MLHEPPSLSSGIWTCYNEVLPWARGTGRRRRHHHRASNPPGLVETFKDEIEDEIPRPLTVDAGNVRADLSDGTRESRQAADKPLVLRGR